MTKGRNRFIILATLWLLGFLPSVASAQAVSIDATNKLHRARGASGQFSAYASDPTIPPVLCAYAERVKSKFLSTLDVSDQWKDPVILVIRREEKESAAVSNQQAPIKIFQTDRHLKYQIDCTLSSTTKPDQLLPPIIESLLLEIANRDQRTYKSKPFQSTTIPPWLVLGITEQIRGNRRLNGKTFQELFNGGRIPNAQSIINDDPISNFKDSEKTEAASANLFTDYLFSLPKGTQKLQQFIKKLGSTKLHTHAFWLIYRNDFPNESYLEKGWALFLARRTARHVAQNLSATETSQRLHEILVTRLIQFRGEKRTSSEVIGEFNNLWRYYEEDWLADALHEKRLQLQALRILAHPRYLESIDIFDEAIQWLEVAKLNRFRRSAKRGNKLLKDTDQLTSKISQYLDEFEKTYDPVKKKY